MYQDDRDDIYADMDAFSTLENIGITVSTFLGGMVTVKGGYEMRYFTDRMNSDNDMLIHSLAGNFFLKGKDGRNDAFMYVTADYNYYASIHGAFTNYDNFQLRVGFGSAN